MDDFFAQYPDFPYQREQSSSLEFYRMCDFFNWDRDCCERQEAHEDFKTALVHRFNGVYGTDVNDIEAWRRLYVALDISPLPDNVKNAQQVRLFILMSEVRKSNC